MSAPDLHRPNARARARSLLATRLLSVLAIVCSAAGALRPARSDDDRPPSAFSRRFGAPVTNVAEGPGGTSIVAGFSTDPSIPGTTELPPLIDPEAPWEFQGPFGWFFVTTLARDGSVEWTTCIAGSAPWERLHDIEVAPDGSVWLLGASEIREFRPFPRAAGDETSGSIHWVARIGPDGSPAFVSRLRGMVAVDLAILPGGDAIVAGLWSPRRFGGAELADHPGVARVYADGRGIAWARTFDSGWQNWASSGTEDQCAVATDPAGTGVCFVVNSFDQSEDDAALGTRLEPPRAPATERRRSFGPGRLTIRRLDADGEVLQTASTPNLLRDWSHLPFGIGASVAVDRQGGLLVTGGRSLIRVTRDLSRISDHWWFRQDDPYELTTAALAGLSEDRSGRVLMSQRRPSESRLTLAALPGGRRFTQIPPAFGFDGSAVVACRDGTTLAVGRGQGIPSNAPPESPESGEWWVARCDLDATPPPAALRAHQTGPREAEVRWQRGGPSLVATTVEEWNGVEWMEVRRLGPEATSLALSDLDPASGHAWRVTTHHGDGMNVCDVVEHVTPPARIRDVVISALSDRLVMTYDASGNSPRAGIVLAVQLASGRWVRRWSGRVNPAGTMELGRRTLRRAVAVRVRVRAGGVTLPWVLAELR